MKQGENIFQLLSILLGFVKMQKSFNLPCFAAFEIGVLVGYNHGEMVAWFMMDIKRVFRGGKR